jgi:hypothetical protein
MQAEQTNDQNLAKERILAAGTRNITMLERRSDCVMLKVEEELTKKWLKQRNNHAIKVVAGDGLRIKSKTSGRIVTKQ